MLLCGVCSCGEFNHLPAINFCLVASQLSPLPFPILSPLPPYFPLPPFNHMFNIAAICTSSPSKSVSLSISYCLFTSSASFSPLSVPHSQSHKKFKQIKLHQYGTPRLLGIGTHQLHPPPYRLLLEWLSEYITTQWVAPTHSNASHNVSDSQFPN